MTNRQAVNRDNYSSPNFSEAIIHNGLVYSSGKVGLDAETGILVSDDAGEQTRAALGLIQAVLRRAGSDLDKLLKCTIHITDMADLAAVNAVYNATIPDPKPARVCVAISELGRGAKVEIDCIAAVGLV